VITADAYLSGGAYLLGGAYLPGEGNPGGWLAAAI